MHLYVAGPMTGRPGFNFETFLRADHVLERMGHTTFNPAAYEVAQGLVPWPEILHMNGDGQELVDAGYPFDRDAALSRDAGAIAGADGVVLLDGWEESFGSVTKVLVAIWAKKSVWHLTGMSNAETKEPDLFAANMPAIHSMSATFIMGRGLR